MRMLSLVSTVTPDDSKAVIEHEIIFIKKKINFCANISDNTAVVVYFILYLSISLCKR